MTAPADLILTGGEVHTLTEPDETHEAVAVRDGEIVRVDRAYEVAFLEGAETEVVDLEGRVLLPGFVDAHTHLELTGRYLIHADLTAAASPDDCVDLLRGRADDLDRQEDGTGGGWVLGYGYDESSWEEARFLTSDDLDRASEGRPVIAFRQDMHVASLNGVAMSRLGDELPADEVRRSGGGPTGVVVEEAAETVRRATAPGPEETRELLLAAQERAHEVGVTCVHEMVRRSHAPRIYRELDLAGDLALRVRLNYWRDHCDAIEESGLRTNHGSEFVRTGAIKTYTDGTFGGRTAKLSEPYADDEGTGTWVVEPGNLTEFVREADAAGFQVAAHAIGDAAVAATLDAYESTDPGRRHRIEHAELLDDTAIDRFAATGAIASVQPNFLKWAREGGLYDTRLGSDRRDRTNRYADLQDAGVRLAFGSDSMPMDPLFGIHQTVNAPVEGQRLGVTEALRAYTHGGAYAGFDERRLGTIEPGKKADLVALEASPWEDSDYIDAIDVSLTVVDGEVVHDARDG